MRDFRDEEFEDWETSEMRNSEIGRVGDGEFGDWESSEMRNSEIGRLRR